MARSQLSFRGVGVVKKREAGSFEGKSYRTYEVSCLDACRRYPLTAEQFELAPGVGSEVEIEGVVETDAKGRDIWMVTGLRRAEVAAGALGRKAA